MANANRKPAANATAAKGATAKPATAVAVVAPPAANAPALSPADKLAAALAGVTLPAATNSAAWLALLASVPEIAAEIAASRAGKYKDSKTVVNAPGDMFSLTAWGATAAESGTMKNGKPNAQAATCRAAALAMAATGETAVCKAAIVFYMVTAPAVLSLLRESKATQYVAKATPCPAWCVGYINGNARKLLLNKA